MQELIDNLQAEKEQLNSRLKEANIRKIETRFDESQDRHKEGKDSNKSEHQIKEVCMLGVGILESSTPISAPRLMPKTRGPSVVVSQLHHSRDIEPELLQQLSRLKTQN
jgi:hypothetical protein